MFAYLKKKYLIILVFLFQLLHYALVFGQDALLCLNPTMHVRMINRIDIDAKRSLLATGSDDKTIRLWELPTGRLMRVIHPPVYPGNEGKIFAVALSPDGKTVAGAGWTKAGYHGFAHFNIYIFDTHTGEMIKYLAGIDDAILHLDFSPDGQYLAAAIAGQKGVHIWDLSNMLEVFQDEDYTADNYWLEFSLDGQYLVTSSYDGYIRLYGDMRDIKNATLLHKNKLKGKNTPFSVRFSPDGERIAAGFTYYPHIAILSKDLQLQYLTAPYETGFGDLFAIAWSPDGRFLYGAGGYKDQNKYGLLQWDEQGITNPKTWQVAWNTITDLRTLGKDEILYASAAPSLGLFDIKGKAIFNFERETAYFQKNFPNKLLVSEDGQMVQFEHDTVENQITLLFSVAEQHLMRASTYTGNMEEIVLSPPVLKSEKVLLDFSRYSNHIKLNNRLLPLSSSDSALSYAFVPKDNTLILGTQFRLYHFDDTGKILWKINTTNFVWAVNVTADKKMVVAALDDGTIRWYRLSDGHLLMTFYPHYDGHRWIAWTPQGIYAASAGANTLVGWHVNNNIDQVADFYPINHLQTYYQPHRLSALLNNSANIKPQHHDESMEGIVSFASEEKVATAVTQAPQTFPPKLILLSPQYEATFDSEEITLEYQYRFHGTPTPVKLHLLLDGRPWQTISSQGVAAKTNKITVTLPTRSLTLTLMAENDQGLSPLETIKLYWQGEKSNKTQHNLNILMIGVNQYQSYVLKRLPITEKDLMTLTNKWIEHSDATINKKSLYNASYNDIMQSFSWLEHNTSQQDISIIFMTGYAKRDEQDTQNSFYFLPSDATQNSYMLSTQDFITRLRKIKGKILLCIDTAHTPHQISTDISQKQNIDAFSAANIDDFSNQLSHPKNGIIVLTSSVGLQHIDPINKKNSFLTALLEALDGMADVNQDGNIMLQELGNYVTKRVSELTDARQTPILNYPKTISDFIIKQL